MIIGVDEVNFSPSLAGDCVVCSYVARKKVRGVKDSKQLTHHQQLELFGKLHEAGYYSIAPATVNDINGMGIYLARNYAIVQSISSMYQRLQACADWPLLADEPIEVIIDGYFSEKWMSYFCIKTSLKCSCMKDGDQKVYEISAASIVARVYADALFSGFGEFYPGYDLEKCHGSPSKTMYAKLRESGPTPYHRTNYGLGWWEKIMKGERRDK